MESEVDMHAAGESPYPHKIDDPGGNSLSQERTAFRPRSMDGMGMTAGGHGKVGAATPARLSSGFIRIGRWCQTTFNGTACAIH